MISNRDKCVQMTNDENSSTDRVPKIPVGDRNAARYQSAKVMLISLMAFDLMAGCNHRRSRSAYPRISAR